MGARISASPAYHIRQNAQAQPIYHLISDGRKPILQAWYGIDVVWYGKVEFNVPLDTV